MVKSRFAGGPLTCWTRSRRTPELGARPRATRTVPPTPEDAAGSGPDVPKRSGRAGRDGNRSVALGQRGLDGRRGMPLVVTSRAEAGRRQGLPHVTPGVDHLVPVAAAHRAGVADQQDLDALAAEPVHTGHVDDDPGTTRPVERLPQLPPQPGAGLPVETAVQMQEDGRSGP